MNPHVIKDHGAYILFFESKEEGIRFKLDKFLTAAAYDGKGYKPKLRGVVEAYYSLYNAAVNWDELKEAVRNAREPEDEVPLEPLPEPGEWDDLLEHIPDYHRYAFEVLMSFVASRKDVENPPWLAVVAPPSTGKTFLMKLFDHPDISLFVDDFTENAIAAGRPNADAAEVNSLLDDANGKTLIMNDMSSVFSQRYDKVNKFIGGLTAAYGGQYTKYSPGAGAERHRSEITVIIGMTVRLYRKHRRYMNILGNRFLYLLLERPKYMRLREDTREFDVNDLRLNVCSFAAKVMNTPDPVIPDEVDDYLFSFVHKVVTMRSIRYAQSWNEVEGESRLYQVMIELCKTRAKIHGQTVVSKEDVDFFKPLAYATIPNMRNLKEIHDMPPYENDIRNPTTRTILKNAKRLGLVELMHEETVEAGGAAKRKITRRQYGWIEEYYLFFEEAPDPIGSEEDDENEV